MEKQKNMGNNSETFRPVTAELNLINGFTDPELISGTVNSMLFRIKHCGKYFIIKTPKQVNAMSLDILKREYEISLALSHYHIANVISFLETSPVGPGILMDYIDGRNLTDFLAENPSEKLRLRVMEQVLSTIAYVHHANIIHNDIKPENILVTRANNDVKLIDFGLSDNDAFYVNKHLGGTPRYASPELLAQEENIDARSDIYSLGILIRDFFGNKYSSISDKCLKQDKTLRYRDAEELMEAWSHRNRRKNFALGCVLLMLLVAAGWGYYGIIKHNSIVSLQKVRLLQDSLQVLRAENLQTVHDLDSVSGRLKTVTTSMDSIAETEQKSKEAMEAMKKQLDDYAEKAIAEFMRIAKRERFSELYWNFAPSVYDKFREDCFLAIDGSDLTQNDKLQMRTYLSYDTGLSKKVYDTLASILYNLPSISSIDDSKEGEFYRNLCKNKEHYRPYKKD